jgi:hypothetical protein
LTDVCWRNALAVEWNDHPAAIGMPVNPVTAFAATEDKAGMQQEKYRFVESESLVMASSHQFPRKLCSLAQANANALFSVQCQGECTISCAF